MGAEHRRESSAVTLRDPAEMPWGKRLAFVQDPEGNVVTLAMPTA